MLGFAVGHLASSRLPPSRDPGPARLRSVDFLRGIAALAVVCHHANTYAGRRPESGWLAGLYAILEQGHLGVPLFFVISGFCIHLTWCRQHAATGGSALDFGGFWRRRLYRLYPPYFVALCVSMGLLVVAYALGREVPLLELYPEPRPRWMMADFLAHATMLHGVHPVFDRAGGNPPFWTLAREEYFYLLYFPLLACRRRLGLWPSALVVLGLGLAFPLLFDAWVPPASRFWPVIQTSAIVLWIQWCLGMIAVEAYCGLVKLPSWCGAFWMVPVWAGLAFVAPRLWGSLVPLLWGLSFFTLINHCVNREQREKWPKGRLVNWFGGVGVFSYSLYLIHNPVRAIVKRCIGPLASTTHPVVYLFAAAFMALCAYWVAKLFYVLVESRFVRTRTRPSGSARRGPQHSRPGSQDPL